MIGLSLKSLYFPSSKEFLHNEILSRISYLVESCYIDSLEPIDKLILFDPYFANNERSIKNLLELIQMEDKYCENGMKNKLLFQSIEIYTLQFCKSLFKQLDSEQLKLIQNIYIKKYTDINQSIFKFHDRFLFFLNSQSFFKDNFASSFYMEMNKGIDDLDSNKQQYSFNVKMFNENPKFILNFYNNITTYSYIIFKGGKYVEE